MSNARLTIIPILACAMLSMAHAAGSGQKQDGASSSKPVNENLATPVVPPLIIIAPTEVRTDPTLAKGCWVRLFPETNFKGVDDLTIAGPMEVKSLHTPVGTDWKHKTESILVGPKSTVIVYENQDFRDKAAILKPGTQEPQLRKGLQFTQSIDSLKISCSR